MVEDADTNKKDIKNNNNIHCDAKSEIQDKINTMIRNMTNGDNSLKRLHDIYQCNRPNRKTNTNK
jgi:hypothetical protein